jgi:hypothetical protein
MAETGGETAMGKLFNIVMRVVSSLIGLLMICFGGVWILQGLNVAFLFGPMVGDRQWVFWGAILALVGVGQLVWSNTRQR